jgi:hypothetical protein
MRKSAATIIGIVLLFWMSQSAFASRETWICLENVSDSPVTIVVTDIDNFDWDGNSRPDHNWHNVILQPGAQQRCERAEINGGIGATGTGTAFTFILNGQSRVRMWYPPQNAEIWMAKSDWLNPSALVLLGSEFVGVGTDCKWKNFVSGGCFNFTGWMWTLADIYTPGKGCPKKYFYCSAYEIGRFDPKRYENN